MKAFTQMLTLISILLISGCTKVLYTHQQVIDKLKAKQDVTNRLGPPAERMILNGQEQWQYNMESPDTSTSTKDVTQFSKLNKYILFTFDAQGNVLKSESKGVDLAERGPATGNTIALVAGGAAVVALIIAIATFHVDLGSMKF